MRKSCLRLSVTVFAIYCGTVGLIAFWPVPVDQSTGDTLTKMLVWLHARGVPTFINYEFIEFCANVLFFIPMGIMLTLWIKSRITTVMISTYVSIGIETVQELLLPQRYPSVLDIIANTIGAAFGVFIFRLLVARFMRSYDDVVEVVKCEND